MPPYISIIIATFATEKIYKLNNMKKFFTLLAAFGLSMVSLQAQEQSEMDALNARLTELEQKQEKQNARNEKWGKIVEKLPEIGGFAKMTYNWDDAGTSNFKINYVRVWLNGNISRQFDYKVQFEFAKPKLIDAYVRWKPTTAFNIQFGQFHVPFSLEGPLNPTKWETIESAKVVDEITGLPDTRDLGFAFYGKFLKAKDEHYLFDYSVGIFQGEGKNTDDKNKSKDVIGRLKFFPIEELCLTGSYSYGEAGEEYIRNQRAAAGVEYKGEALSIRSEYLWHQQGNGELAVKNDGCYVVAAYKVKNFAPTLRYNFYNQQTAAGHLEQSDYVVGLNYMPVKYVKLQLNYTLTTFSESTMNNLNTIGFAAIAMF
ncbi:MAG: hypothetical protein E7137_06965 [Rikenellaceae bacterium]|nr:hypothetical protein [Rikenellaceae bacterium]